MAEGCCQRKGEHVVGNPLDVIVVGWAEGGPVSRVEEDF
jgi:hypothetical protein